MAEPRVSIILPVHNQADHIEEIVAEYREALGRVPIPHETILVVNGCRDRSLEICSALARASASDSVRVASSDLGGWGRAVKLGIREARGELLCYTNSARTSPQDLLLCVLYAIANPGVVVKANRKIRESVYRRLGSLLFNLECRALFDLSNWDVNGTPKVFPRSFEKLRALARDDDLIDLEFDVICRREGYPMLEIPIFSARRHGGRSTTTFRSAFKLYLGAIEMRRASRRPEAG